MNNKPVFYELSPSSMNACNLTPQAKAKAQQSWLCPGCVSPKPGVGPVDVQIQQSRIKDQPLSFVRPGVPLALRSFLDRLDKEVVQRDLYLGRVFGPDGRELEDWCTCLARHRIIVRGSDDPADEISRAGYRICKECGQTRYFAQGVQYLYPDPLASDAELFTDGCSLIVPEHVITRLKISDSDGIYITRLNILDSPLDGFGELFPVEADQSKWGDHHKSKRGYTTFSNSLLAQGKEDVQGIKQGYYRRVYWHFFPDDETGQIAIDPELLEAMEDSGIMCVLHNKTAS
mgnify:CR=1 FL=1